MRFWAILDTFSIRKCPIVKAFWDFPWPKTRHYGLKTAKNTCLTISNGLGSLLDKCVFGPFLTHF